MVADNVVNTILVMQTVHHLVNRLVEALLLMIIATVLGEVRVAGQSIVVA
jgi:hypothetical protein